MEGRRPERKGAGRELARRECDRSEAKPGSTRPARPDAPMPRLTNAESKAKSRQYGRHNLIAEQDSAIGLEEQDFGWLVTVS